MCAKARTARRGIGARPDSGRVLVGHGRREKEGLTSGPRLAVGEGDGK